MSIESDLRKDGISVIEPLDKASIDAIAKSVSEKIVTAFPNFGFTFDSLYSRFSNLPMYIANIPFGSAEASYFYKNSSVYFRDGMGLNSLEKFATHELIHNLQEQKSQKGKLVRLGLCTFNGSKTFGMALNEAAVQYAASSILDSKFETVTYYGITFSTISPNYYPLLCNLIAQMAYITGEEVLFDSTLNCNDYFKNKFSALCGESVYTQISTLLDKILDLEGKIITLRNKQQNKELAFEKSHNLSNKIENLKEEIRTAYFSAQELIIKSYFSTVYKSLMTSVDLDRFRKKLYSFQEYIGTVSDYYFFNNFYIEMMEKLDKKFDVLSDIVDNGSTYLIPRKENKILKIIGYIKKLFLKKQLEKENSRGITLISLVITFVIMTILAGVTLSIALGDHGLVENSRNTNDETRVNVVTDKIKIWKKENTLSNTLGDADALIQELLDDNLIYADEIDRANQTITLKQDDGTILKVISYSQP